MQGLLLGILQFAAAVLILPVVVALTDNFYRQVLQIKSVGHVWLAGIFAFTIMHLFICNLKEFFHLAQKALTGIFRFSAGVASTVTYLIPWGPVLLLLVYYICATFFKTKGIDPYVFFLLGFFLAMHVILSAQTIHEDDKSILKGHYFFVIILVVIINLLIVAALLDLNFVDFSFPHFFDLTFQGAKDHYLFLQQKLLRQ